MPATDWLFQDEAYTGGARLGKLGTSADEKKLGRVSFGDA